MKQTLGSIVYDLLEKKPDSRDPIEIQRELQSGTEEELWKCVWDHQKLDNFQNKDFYVVMRTSIPVWSANRVIRNKFWGRHSAPTPNFNETVYKYDHKKGEIEYLWNVPDEDTCQHFMNNALKIDPSEQWLFSLVLDYYDGTLLRKAKQLNGEISLESELIERK